MLVLTRKKLGHVNRIKSLIISALLIGGPVLCCAVRSQVNIPSEQVITLGEGLANVKGIVKPQREREFEADEAKEAIQLKEMIDTPQKERLDEWVEDAD